MKSMEGGFLVRVRADMRRCAHCLQSITLVYVDLRSSPLAAGIIWASPFSLSQLQFPLLQRGDWSFQLYSEPTTCHWGSAMRESQDLPLKSSRPTS